MTNLTSLRLENNSISDISALENLTNLTSLRLENNSISDISALEDLTNLIYLYLASNSISDYGPLRRLIAAIEAAGRSLTLDITIPPVSGNNAPVFDDTTTTRSVAENTASGQNIGTAVDATDADSDTLTYSLGGTDAASFSIVTTSGQLQTSASLDYETKTSYTVTVSVSDGNGGSDSITVTINVTDVSEGTNNAPVFDDTTATRSVAENTASGENIGTAVAATDADNDTLTYSLGGTDAASFSIVTTSGQLQTSASLDYETKTSYTVTVSVSDGNGGSDSITVTISVTDVEEQITQVGVCKVGDVIQPGGSCTYPDTNIEFTVSNSGLGQFLFFSSGSGLNIENTTINGVLYTFVAEKQTDGSWEIEKVGDDGTSNNAPTFTDGTTATRSVAENTASGENIGDAVAATDADNDTLTYSLGGTDAASFSIVTTSGQLQTSASLNYETKTSYTVTVSVSDGNSGSDSITVTINVTDVTENTNNAPVFTEGTSTTRSVAENTASGQNIGTAVGATDADSSDTLTYTLGGTDAASFSIVRTSGQLQTSASLNYETKTSYTVTVSVSDGNSGSDSITVTINVTDVDPPPPLAPITINITTCSGSPRIGDLFDITVGGTITANQRVRIISVTGYLNTALIGVDGINEILEAGDTVNFTTSGVWFHDGSTDQTCSATVDYLTFAAPSAQAIPAKSALLPNFPNPFNPETWIPYELSKPAEVTLTIYNMQGQVIRQLKLGQMPAGVYRSRSRAIHWNGRNIIGEKVAAGVYFYTLTAGDFTATRKMLIRK